MPPTEDSAPEDYIKIALTGDLKSGKTVFSTRFCYDRVDPEYFTTQGIEVRTKRVTLKNKERTQLKISLWELGGNPKFHPILPYLYNQTRIGVVFIDLTNPHALSTAPQHVENIRKHATNKKIPIFIVATKADLINQRVITYDDLVAFCHQHSINQCFVTSTKVPRKKIGEMIIKMVKETYPKLFNTVNNSSTPAAATTAITIKPTAPFPSLSAFFKRLFLALKTYFSFSKSKNENKKVESTASKGTDNQVNACLKGTVGDYIGSGVIDALNRERHASSNFSISPPPTPPLAAANLPPVLPLQSDETSKVSLAAKL